MRHFSQIIQFLYVSIYTPIDLPIGGVHTHPHTTRSQAIFSTSAGTIHAHPVVKTHVGDYSLLLQCTFCVPHRVIWGLHCVHSRLGPCLLVCPGSSVGRALCLDCRVSWVESHLGQEKMLSWVQLNCLLCTCVCDSLHHYDVIVWSAFLTKYIECLPREQSVVGSNPT